MALKSERTRIVCVGDSITDGYTYGQIIMQALRDTGRPEPVVICAGVASDTAEQMAARFDRDALRYDPELVTFSAGSNDTVKGVTVAQYERAIREIAEKCKARAIPMILQTPCAMNAGDTNKPNEAAEAMGMKYAGVVRAVAKEYGYPVAETGKLQKDARAAGKRIMVADGTHPNYLGQSLMARAILDAMGCKDVPLPREFLPELFPGVIPEWKMKPAPIVAGKPQPLTEAIVGGLKVDDTWKTYKLPDAPPEAKVTAEDDWREQCRRNGYALQMATVVGKGPIYAVATVRSNKADQPQKAWINTAVGVQQVYLNGKLVYTHPQVNGGDVWTGFHAGKERIEVVLKPGLNTLVVQHAGGDFFVGVTDKLIWEEDITFGG